jgi:hypothetical protein
MSAVQNPANPNRQIRLLHSQFSGARLSLSDADYPVMLIMARDGFVQHYTPFGIPA